MATLSSWKTPKHCVVHSVDLRDGVADIGYRCGTSGRQDAAGREPPDGMFDQPGGGRGTYPHVHVRAPGGVAFRGAHITGGGRIGFVLMPASAVCRKTRADRELRCSLVGDTSSPSLRGARRRRRRR